jgi:DNA-binding NarL/FixJ family response regulator
MRSRLGYPSVLIGSHNTKLRAQWRAGLRGGYAVEEASDRDKLERLLSTFAPDILLLDFDFPRLTRAEDVQSLQALSRETWIVVLSKSPNEWEGLSALKAGARGYCGKDIDPLLLRKVVDRVHEGEIWAGRRLIPRLMEEYASRPDDRRQLNEVGSDGRLDLLTHRELEIARLVGAGASNKEIASRLNIGEGTVKAHLTATFRKLCLADRLGLGLYMQKV